jgi:hypothetical protein
MRPTLLFVVAFAVLGLATVAAATDPSFALPGALGACS